MIIIGFFIGVGFMMVLRWVLFRLNKKAVEIELDNIEKSINSWQTN